MSLAPEEVTKLKTVADRLELNFQNLDLLKEALTHRSYLNEMRSSSLQHNERLEFLGDAVLELLSTKFLFTKYPDRPEGDLTSFRAALVRTESLAEASISLGFGDDIYMSKGEAATGGRTRPYILANTFEAVLGAIFLDQGLDACQKLLDRIILPKIDAIVADRLDIDSKSKLQEIAQEMLKHTPTYQVISESGPDHDKVFTMSVMIGKESFGKGEGKSKQEAEQNAAQAALTNWDELYQKYRNSVTITGN